MARSVAAATAAACALAGVSEALETWTSFPSLNCYTNQEMGYVGAEALGDGTDPVRLPSQRLSIEECKTVCENYYGCTAIVTQDVPNEPTCWLRKNVQVADCSSEWSHMTLWLRGNTNQQDEQSTSEASPFDPFKEEGDPVPQPSYQDKDPESMGAADGPAYAANGGGIVIEDAGDWNKVAGRNCWTGHGGRAVHWDAAPVSGHKSQSECQNLCLKYDNCEAIVYTTTSDTALNNCYLRKEVHISSCTEAFAANMDVFIRPKFYGRVMNAWEANDARAPGGSGDGGGGRDGLLLGSSFLALGIGAGAAALFAAMAAAAMLGFAAKRTAEVGDSRRLMRNSSEECPQSDDEAMLAPL